MKTAEEYYKEYCRSAGTNRGDFIKLINEARIEALKEAAEKVNYPYKDEYGAASDVPSIVLQLINEIK